MVNLGNLEKMQLVTSLHFLFCSVTGSCFHKKHSFVKLYLRNNFVLYLRNVIVDRDTDLEESDLRGELSMWRS